MTLNFGFTQIGTQYNFNVIGNDTWQSNSSNTNDLE